MVKLIGDEASHHEKRTMYSKAAALYLVDVDIDMRLDELRECEEEDVAFVKLRLLELAKNRAFIAACGDTDIIRFSKLKGAGV